MSNPETPNCCPMCGGHALIGDPGHPAQCSHCGLRTALWSTCAAWKAENVKLRIANAALRELVRFADDAVDLAVDNASDREAVKRATEAREPYFNLRDSAGAAKAEEG